VTFSRRRDYFDSQDSNWTVNDMLIRIHVGIRDRCGVRDECLLNKVPSYIPR
jgi:hypothetical protein